MFQFEREKDEVCVFRRKNDRIIMYHGLWSILQQKQAEGCFLSFSSWKQNFEYEQALENMRRRTTVPGIKYANEVSLSKSINKQSKYTLKLNFG